MKRNYSAVLSLLLAGGICCTGCAKAGGEATAAQKLCIFKLFPIIFHDVVDNLPSFIVYQVLREILDLVSSYPFRKQWLPMLDDLRM